MKGAGWAFVVGVVLAGVSVFLVDRYVSGVEAQLISQPYLRLKADAGIARGQVVTVDALEVVNLPEMFVNLRAIAVPYNEESLALINTAETRVTKDIAPGSFLLFEHIVPTPDDDFAARIGVGMRALSVPVTAISSVSYFVGPGSRVDILVTVTERQESLLTANVSPQAQAMNGVPAGAVEQRLVTKTLLQNVAVLAVGSSVTAGNYLDTAGGYNTVTFEVTPVQAELLTFAMVEADGGLGLVLRNPANNEEEDIPAVSWDDIQ